MNFQTKIVLFITIIFSFVSFSFTQPEMYANKTNPDYRLFKLHYENSTGEKGVTTFDYKGGKVLSTALWQLLDGKRNSVNYYTYNDKGQLVKKYRIFSDKRNITQIFEYDEAGNLVTRRFDRTDGVKGLTRITYKDGLMIKSEANKMNGWLTGTIYYKYDENKRFKSGTFEQEGKTVATIKFTYDKNNNLATEYWDFSGKFNQTFRFEYQKIEDKKDIPYTSTNPFININTGFIIENENYDYSGKTGGPSYFEYDKNNKLIKKTFVRSDGVKTVTEFFYMADKKLAKTIRQFADGKSAIFTYKYNDDRKLLSRKMVSTDEKTGSEEYRYCQRDGRLVEAKWVNFDTWLTGEISFDHNDDDLPIKGFFKGEKFSADITFEYDEHKNLTKIFWKFKEFEGSQTYTFKYKKIN